MRPEIHESVRGFYFDGISLFLTALPSVAIIDAILSQPGGGNSYAQSKCKKIG
jgi:hypothetical protein